MGRGKKAWDDPIFREHFDKELNPEIDPTTLYKSDTKTKFVYKRFDGCLGRISVGAFFRNIARNNGVFIDNALAHIDLTERPWNNACFREWFNKELNSDINPLLLKKSDQQTRLRYYDNEGQIRSITVGNFFENIKKNNIFIPGKLSKILVFDQPAFREWYCSFCNSLNEDLDITKERSQSRKMINFRDEKANIGEISIKAAYIAIKAGRIPSVPVRPVKEERKEFDELSSVLNTTLNNIPGFADIFDQSLNPRINLAKDCLATCKKRHIYHKQGANIFSCPIEQVVKALIQGKFIDWKKSNHKIIPGINDVCTLDPTIAMYWGNNKRDLKQIGPTSSRRYNFVCPYCGHEFSKAMKNIALKEVKCPNCHDTGYDFEDYDTNFTIGTFYLLQDYKLDTELEYEDY